MRVPGAGCALPHVVSRASVGARRVCRRAKVLIELDARKNGDRGGDGALGWRELICRRSWAVVAAVSKRRRWKRDRAARAGVAATVSRCTGASRTSQLWRPAWALLSPAV